MTNLNSRQKELLARIVRHYVDRAEPVSSGQLAQEFNLSPATLRNEMSELERLGYIYQPHTSAGRIPAEAAFRFYISEYVKEKEPNKKAKDELKTACQTPDSQTGIKQLSRKLADLSSEVVIIGFGRSEVYYTGLTNLFTQPEFHNAQLVINFTRLLDHLDEMISQIFDLVDQDIKVMVGKENPFGQEFGTMITKCQFDQRQGLLVLLGPMRMDYEDNLGLMNFSKFLIESQKYD